MVSVDMRTRLDADVVLIDPVTFVADELSDLIRRNGHLAARGAALVGAKALGIDVEGTGFTLVPTERTMELRSGTADARVVVECAIETVIELPGEPESNRSNDGAGDPRGRLFQGTMSHAEPGAPVASLYRVDGDGTARRVLSDVMISNGIGWSPDLSTMYYIDTLTFRVDRFDYDPDTGEIEGRRPFVTFDGTAGAPDGMTVDADGCLWWRCSAATTCSASHPTVNNSRQWSLRARPRAPAAASAGPTSTRCTSPPAGSRSPASAPRASPMPGRCSPPTSTQWASPPTCSPVDRRSDGRAARPHPGR